MNKFLKECYLQKTNQFDALRVPNMKENLDVTSPLKLSLVEDEDGCTKIVTAVKEIVRSNEQVKSYTIGVLSDDDAKDIKLFLAAGWGENVLFECRVCKFDEKADENKRISVAIYINQHNNR